MMMPMWILSLLSALLFGADLSWAQTARTQSGGGSGGSGVIVDGANTNIKATVHDYTNSNPLAVTLKDTNGDAVAVGGGTQYAQGAASTTTDQLTMAGCVRVDTPAVASGVIDGDRARCIVDSTNRIWVHVGVIDGTVAVTQSGTWNIGALTSITNPVAVTGTFWQATQPISGTVTANAGTGNFTVTQGTGTNLHVVCDSGCSGGTQYAEDSAHSSGDTLTLAGVVQQSSDGALAADGDRTLLQVDGSGYLKVINKNPNVAADDASNGTAKVPVLPCVANASAPTWTEAHMAPCSVNTSGAMRVTGTVTVTDGSGSLNTIVDSGTITAVTTITNPVTVTDGSGALNVICDSGCSGGTQYNQGTAGTATDALSMAGAVRKDTAAVDGGVADGDRVVLSTDSAGRLRTTSADTTQPVSGTVTVTDGSGALNVIVDSGTVTTVTTVGTITNPVTVTDGSGALNVICDSGCSGGTQYTEDAAAAGGETLTLAGTVRQDTPASSNADGDYANLKTDSVGRLWVNGSGVTQPVSGTVSITSNSAVNIAQMNGVATTMGNGASGTGVQRVTIASDSTGVLAATQSGAWNITNVSGTVSLPTGAATAAKQPALGTAGSASTDVLSIQGIASMTPLLANPGTAANWGVYTEDAAETAGGNLSMSGSVRRDTAASSAGSTGDNATINTDQNGLLWTRNIDPCTALAKTFLPINISTATTTELTPSLAGASTNYYVCSLNLVTAAANNVALVDDDTDNCASITSGLAGGTTAASGWNFAANGGMTLGNGQSSIFKTNGANRVLCLVTSAATQLSGNMTVVSAP